ncbi:MAG: hypothetical protein IIZ73_08680 [Ruminococcus sp.]|nr:hypothetical protein [Ruminococcus sp.]
MEMIRNALFTACITAMISAVVMTIAPANRKRELRLICTLVLISCLAAGLAGKDTALSLPKLGDRQTWLSEYDDMLLSQSRSSMERSLTESLKKAGFSPKLVSIEVAFDQYNYIRAERAEVCVDCTDEQTMQRAESAVRDVIGADGEVYIYDTSSETAAEGD